MSHFSGVLPSSNQAQPRWRLSVEYRWEHLGPKPQTGSNAEPENTYFASESEARSAFQAINQQDLESQWKRPDVNCRLRKISVELQERTNSKWGKAAPPRLFNL